MPFFILGSMYAGVCTPTEAAALACLIALIIGVFFHRDLNLAGIWIAIRDSARATSMIFIIIATASFLSTILTYTQLPQKITAACLAYAISPMTFMMASAVALLILGTFMEAVPNWYLAGPIMYAVAKALGVPAMQLYIFASTFIGIGLLTPPVCVGAYTAAGVLNLSADEIFKYIFPTFFLLLCGCGIIYMFVPWLSTWLPSMVR